MRSFIAILLLLFLSASAFSLDVIRTLVVSKAVYNVSSPPPFGDLQITFDSDIEGDVKCIYVDSDIGQITIPKEVLDGVRLIGVPEVSYNYSSLKKTGSIEEVQIFVEFGEYVELYMNEEYQKRILGFSVSENNKVEVLRIDK